MLLHINAINPLVTVEVFEPSNKMLRMIYVKEKETLFNMCDGDAKLKLNFNTVIRLLFKRGINFNIFISCEVQKI